MVRLGIVGPGRIVERVMPDMVHLTEVEMRIRTGNAPAHAGAFFDSLRLPTEGKLSDTNL